MTKKNPVNFYFRVKLVFVFISIIFLLVFGMMFISGLMEFFRLIIFPIWILFTVLGFYLTYLTFKAEIKGKLKVFLLLSGLPAILFFLFVILHNFFYAGAIITDTTYNFLVNFYHFRFNLYTPVLQGLEVVFFLLAVLGCPIAFIVGAVGSGYLMLKGDNVTK